MHRILANVAMPLVEIIYIVIGIKIFDGLVAAGRLSKSTSRKFVHIRAGNRLLFRIFADLSHRSKFFRLFPPLLFASLFVIKSRAPPDDPFVRSMSRTGDPKEMLGGTFHFTVTSTIILVAYLLVPELRLRAILAMVVMGRGDGVAALLGGRIRIGSRSLSGTISFIVFAFLFGVLYGIYFGYGGNELLRKALYAAIAGAIIELATPSGYDNLSVPIGVLLLGYALEFL